MVNIYSYNGSWQRPNKTEEWAEEQLRAGAKTCDFAEVISFPWASYIDREKRHGLDACRDFQSFLESIPPRKTLIRATICQHIWAMDLMPWFKRLKITDIFWVHATKSKEVVEGIRIHPFPLYPVQYFETMDASANASSALTRNHLYSFIGAYNDTGYLSRARRWVFELPERPDSLVIKRASWHYEAEVYGQQIDEIDVTASEAKLLADNSRGYVDAMKTSIFSLCPSGTGPNSIRFWEALAFGSIPVLISDELRLPGPLGVWDNAILRVEETKEAVNALPDLLESMARRPDYIQKMQDEGQKLWKNFGEKGPETLLDQMLSLDNLASLYDL